jgi:small subunit ribosomal protein S17
VCYVHDETEQAAQGDTVEIIESRPRSRTKRWELVRIVDKGRNQAAVSLSEISPGSETK